MRVKIMLAIVCMLTLFVAGCVDQINESTNITPNATERPSPTGAAEGESNESVSTSPTPTGNITESGQIPTENRSVYMMEYSFSSRNATLYVGGQLSFVHHQTNDYPTFVLVSDEGLWKNQTMNYGDVFSYTFNQTGVYHFHVKGYGNAMTGTVWVVER
ncbi:MAG: cupredoxin domain-containing protein [Methermicoccaceae archaeon]